jgi:zinc transporter 2
MGLLLYYGGHGHSHGGMTAAASQRSEDHPERGIATLTDPVPGSSAEININVRAAFIHVIGDMIQSIGVLLAALVILWDVS